MEGGHIPGLLKLMNVTPSRCAVRLVETLERVHSVEFGENEKQMLQELAKSTTSQEFDGHIRTLTRASPDVASWLQAHQGEFAAFCFLQQKLHRFGAVVSNANDLLDSAIQRVKDQPVASMTTSLMMNLSSIYFERHHKARNWLEDGQQISDHAKEVYEKIIEDSETCQVQVIDHVTVVWRILVSQPRGETSSASNMIVTINSALFQLSCSCQRVEEMGIPCVHCAAALSRQNLQPRDHRWFHPRYHSSTIMRMYDFEPSDMSVFGKLSAEELLPPEHKLVGPPKRRKIPTNAPAKPHKCTACGELGHHPKTCLNPSTEYRYKNYVEKANQWAESSCLLQAPGLLKRKKGC